MPGDLSSVVDNMKKNKKRGTNKEEEEEELVNKVKPITFKDRSPSPSSLSKVQIEMGIPWELQIPYDILIVAEGGGHLGFLLWKVLISKV